jgi:hypothetical protein
MTAYDNTPQSVVEMLIAGKPSYAYGSRSPGPTCRMIIDHDSVTTNVVTLAVTIIDGNIPLVGDLIYVYNTSNSAGALNQTTGIAISGVNITAATGKGTITYPKTVGNQGNTVDTGYALSTPQELAEALTTNKSRAFAIQNTIGRGYGITWAFTYPSAPASASIQLEGAVNDVDSEYTIIGAANTSVSGYNEIIATLPELVNFVRLHVTAASGGTNPTVVGKILPS